MKQIIQSATTGKLELVEVPAPAPGAGQVLVRNHFSVVSPGTEKLGDELRAQVAARQGAQPAGPRASRWLRKLRQEGPLPTYRDGDEPPRCAAAARLLLRGRRRGGGRGRRRASRRATAWPAPAPATRTTPSGRAFPRTWWRACPTASRSSRPPSPRSARSRSRACASRQPTLGEIAAVIGLGLIGQLAVQLLRANGCRVLGIDLDADAREAGPRPGRRVGRRARRRLAPAGATPRPAATASDLALVTAASESSAPIQLAAELCRMKGRIAVVGATADGSRPPHLLREGARAAHEHVLRPGPLRPPLRGAGPRLSAPLRALDGEPQPPGLPRARCLGAVDAGAPRHRRRCPSPRRCAPTTSSRGAERALAWRSSSATTAAASAAAACSRSRRARAGAPRRGRRRRLPRRRQLRQGRAAARRSAAARTSAASRVVTATGASARRTAEKFGFASLRNGPGGGASTTPTSISSSSPPGTTATPRLAEAALRAGKAVWLEKPVATRRRRRSRPLAAPARDGRLPRGRLQPPLLAPTPAPCARRFADRARSARASTTRSPAGPAARAAPGSRIRDVGGGRIIGEACHFVDLCTYLVGAPPQRGLRAGPRPRSRDRRFHRGHPRLPRRLDAPRIDYLAHASARAAEGALRGLGRRPHRALRQLPRRPALGGAQGR